MLKFFRKYQKYVFFFITTIVIITFSFWGTYTSQSPTIKRKDTIVSKSITGSSISQSDISLMSWFLSSDWENTNPSSHRVANLLNDGVLSKDFIGNGIADLLQERYFPILKTHQEKNLTKIKKYIPYKHPQVDFISAKDVWKEFSPKILDLLEEIQKQEKVNTDYFSLINQLYQEQNSFPPFLLKKALLYQQSKFPWVSSDERIYQDNLSLFGFQTLSDWFGQDFLDLCSQFLLNIAALAEKEHIDVSYEEAQQDLFHNLHMGLKKFHLTDDLEHFTSNLEQQLTLLRINEETAISLWKKVLLFRKYLQEVTKGTLVDPLLLKEFYSYAKEKKEIVSFELPKYLELKDFKDLMKLQVYLQSVCGAKNTKDSFLILSSKYLPIEKIESSTPWLVEQKYKVQMNKVGLSSLALKIGEKQLWDWQLEEKNWDTIKAQFSRLTSCGKTPKDTRFHELEKQDPFYRFQIDQFARKCMVLENSSLIKEELAKLPKEEKVLSFTNLGNDVNIDKMEKAKSLQSLLDQASTNDAQAKEALLCYTQDGSNYYSFTLVGKNEKKNVLSFSVANERGILDQELESYLKKEYAKLKVSHHSMFFDEKNQEKPFAQIQNEIGKIAFAPLLQAIEKDARKQGIVPKASKEDFYVTYRLHGYLQKMKSELGKDISDAKLLWQKDSLEDQWKLCKEEISLSRDDKDKKLVSLVFHRKLNSWSSIENKEGKLFFFFVKNIPSEPVLSIKEMEKCRSLLQNEAICYLAEKLIDQLEKTKAIVLPIHQE